jgi:hypothetical protein
MLRRRTAATRRPIGARALRSASWREAVRRTPQDRRRRALPRRRDGLGWQIGLGRRAGSRPYTKRIVYSSSRSRERRRGLGRSTTDLQQGHLSVPAFSRASLRCTKMGCLQGFRDGETRTRTGDTTIFRESWTGNCVSRMPANQALRGHARAARYRCLPPPPCAFGTSGWARSPKRAPSGGGAQVAPRGDSAGESHNRVAAWCVRSSRPLGPSGLDMKRERSEEPRGDPPECDAAALCAKSSSRRARRGRNDIAARTRRPRTDGARGTRTPDIPGCDPGALGTASTRKEAH